MDPPSLIALTDFIGHLLCGELPNEIMSIWASAKLPALTKANGKPHPIAVGEILRRIAQSRKMCWARLTDTLAPTLARLIGESG